MLASPLAAAQRQAWGEIAPYFNPPKEWRGKLGKYRSPLRFKDGSRHVIEHYDLGTIWFVGSNRGGLMDEVP